MSRSLGQIAVSVVATLLATLLTSGLVEKWRGPAPSPGPASPADRAASRPDGVAAPVLSVVDWSVTARHPDRLVVDPGWTGSAAMDDPAEPTPAPPRKPTRHTLRKSVAGPEAAPAPTASPAAPLALHASPAPLPAPDLVSRTATQARTLVAAGGSALVVGGAQLLHRLPWPR